MAAVRNKQLGFVFQDFLLLDGLTVRQNILLPAILGGSAGPTAETRADQLCQVFGITPIQEKYSAEISGGEKQRTAVARALINNPLLILADEPTGNLDTAAPIEIMEIFSELHKAGATVVVVTHEENIAAFTDRIIRFSDGQIISDEKNLNPTPGSGVIHTRGLYGRKGEAVC